MNENEHEVTVTLTVREARALRNCAEMMIAVLDAHERDEPPAAVTAIMKVEVALVVEGAVLR